MGSSKNQIYCLIILLAFVKISVGCSGGGIGAGSQNYQNPTINMKFFTPTLWTYPPSDASTLMTYFLGQASSQSQAQNNAITDLTSSITLALQDNGFNAGMYKITPTYTAPLVYDCAKAAQGTPANLDWYETEGEIVTKHVTGATQAITGTNCISKNAGQTVLTKTDFILDARITIDGLTVNSIQMTQILNAFMAQLSFGRDINSCTIGDIDLASIPRAINSKGKKTMTITIKGSPPVEWTYFEENINKAFPGQFHIQDVAKYIIEEDLKNGLIHGMLSWGVNPNYHPMTTTNVATYAFRCDRRGDISVGTSSIMAELENGFVTKKLALTSSITTEDCVKTKYTSGNSGTTTPLIVENSITAGLINLRKEDAQKVVEFFVDYMTEMKKLHAEAEVSYVIT
uniref:DUF4136 domain-containing protein n=1 Tax=Strongyloides stercoralis TaxID=6248 RepID=A0A0K0EIT4_STRER